MFDLPDSKRVRRDELASPSSSSPPLSPQELDSSYPLNTGLEKFFSFDTFTTPETQVNSENDGKKYDQEGGDKNAGQEFEFRLFRKPVPSHEELAGDSGKQRDQSLEKDGMARPKQVQATKIRIRSPTPAEERGDGRFTVPFRGWGFYFSEPEQIAGDEYVRRCRDRDMAAKRSEYIDAAVAGEQVLGERERPWPGCHLPWRVTHIRATTSSGNQKQKANPSTTSKKPSLKDKDIASCLKRKNLGKKRRIILRKALAAQAAAKEADQEKKTRKNREKKVKRRQREREKKAAAEAGGIAATDPGADTQMGGSVESDSGSE